MADRKLSITITGDAKSAKKAIGDLEKSLGQADAATKRSGSNIKSTLAGLGVGAALFGAAKAFDESRKVAAQTEAVIKSTGGAANVTADQVNELSEAISKKTGLDDEAIQSGANTIAMFKGIANEAGKGSDVFDRTTKMAVDMAAALGTDIPAAAQQLGKALNDPMAGLGRLSKYFTEQQREMIKAVAESGDKLGAQKLILDGLATTFQGSAERQKTAFGSAQVSIDNFAESIGQAMSPVLDVAATVLGKFADTLGALPGPLQTAAVLTAGGGAAWLKWGDALSTVQPKMWNTIASLQNMSGKMGTAAKGIAVLGAGFAAYEVTLSALENNAAFKGDLSGLGKDLSQVGRDVADVDVIFDHFGGNADELADRFRDLKDSWVEQTFDFGWTSDAQNASEDLKALDSQFAELAGTNPEQARQALVELVAALSEQGITTEQVMAVLPKLNTELERQGRETKTTADKTKELDGAFAGVVWSQEKQTEASKNQADKLRAIADEADHARDNIRKFYDEITGQLDKTVAVEQAYDDLTKSLMENGKTFAVGTQEGRDNIKALEDYKKAAADAAIAARDAIPGPGGTQAGIEALQGYADRYVELGRKAGLTKDQINAGLVSMGLTSTQIKDTFHANATVTETDAIRVKDSIDKIPGNKSIKVAADTAEAQQRLNELRWTMAVLAGGVISGKTKIGVDTSLAAAEHVTGARASGGPVSPHATYKVNEKGEELLTMGSRSGLITSAAKTQALLSGGSGGAASSSGAGSGGTQTIVMQVVLDGRVIGEASRNYIIRNSKMNVGDPIGTLRGIGA